MRVTKLVVGKGKTARVTSHEEWLKEYFEIEIEIEDEQELEIARANALGLIDSWLSYAFSRPKQTKDVSHKGPLTPEIQAGTVEHVDKGGKLYARMVHSRDKLIILPVESLEIKASDKAISNFLVPRILDKLKEKHGVTYRMEVERGLLRSIEIVGRLSEKTRQELKSPVAWAFQKASQR